MKNKILILLIIILIISYILLYNKYFSKGVVCTSTYENQEYKKTNIVYIGKEINNKIIIDSDIKEIINQFNLEYKKEYEIILEKNKLIATNKKKYNKNIINTLEKNGYTCKNK